MNDTPTTRRRNLLMQLALFSQLEIAEGRGGSAASFAERVGIHPSLLSKLRGAQPGQDTRDISDKLARQIEARLGLQAGWLDERRDEAPMTSGEASFVELALRAYRNVDAKARRELRKRMEALAEGEASTRDRPA